MPTNFGGCLKNPCTIPVPFSAATESLFMDIRYFGIRHHGAGSARHLLTALHDFQPDRILLEGPPEADSLLHLAGESDMVPPVALLAYRSDKPQHAVYYPFAEFSPEWQAIRFAQTRQVPLRFFDLPLAHSLYTPDDETESTPSDDEAKTSDNKTEISEILLRDPFDYLAAISGSRDGESFWEETVEQRLNGEDLFAAIQTAVTALRGQLPEYTRSQDLLREAYMRKIIRQTAKEAGVERIAVVCGAWHVPALDSKVPVKDDNALLKGLPKCKVECTWIPWTNSRLTQAGGYGAGIRAPEWYAHLWQHPDDDGVLWVGRTAALLRQQNFDVSAAHVIETVRLAQSCAALRGRSKVSLDDFTEACTSVMGMGSRHTLDTIRHSLLVGNRIGSVPAATPQLPLIADVEKQRKKLRLPQTAESKTIELDLRKEHDLQKSRFLHRLNLLGIDWGETVHSRSKGTFKETWELCYHPEHTVRLTERAVYGNTLENAVCAYTAEKIRQSRSLPELTALLVRTVPAGLPELTVILTAAIENLSADSNDTAEILAALPDLTGLLRYGSVRGQADGRLQHLLLTLLARLAAGGIQSCLNIDRHSADGLFEQIRRADYPLGLLDDGQALRLWTDFIHAQQSNPRVHPLLRGNAVRILFDREQLDADNTALLLRQNLSGSHTDAADWLEGFLYQSGGVLLVHDALWHIIYDWVGTLPEENFTALLPLLRRTFSTFEFGERRQLGEKVRTASASPLPSNQQAYDGVLPFDENGGREAVMQVMRLLCPTASAGTGI